MSDRECENIEWIIPEELWKDVKCPRCNGGLEWFSEGDSVHGSDGVEYWPLCCDLSEAFCTKCNINLPYCPLCTYIPPNFVESKYTFNLPSCPEPQPGDIHFLTFLGCNGDTEQEYDYLVRPNYPITNDKLKEMNAVLSSLPPYDGEFTADKIGLEIPYIIDNPQPGYDEKCIPKNIVTIGSCGGSPTYWWCPKWKIAQSYTDK